MPLPPSALSPFTPQKGKGNQDSLEKLEDITSGAEHVYNVQGVTCQTRMQEARKDYSFLLKVLRREQEESIIGQKKGGEGFEL